MSYTREQVQSIVTETVIEVIGNSSPVLPTSMLDDLNADSLDVVEIIMHLEENFDIFMDSVLKQPDKIGVQWLIEQVWQKLLPTAKG
jgi:acyl carrier protein